MTRGNVILLSSILIALLIIVGGILFLRSGFLMERLRRVLEQQLEKELNTEVSVGRMHGNVLTGLAAEEIRIADKRPDTPTPVIAVREASIKYKLIYLLRGKFLVDQILLKRPQVNVRVGPQGQTNLALLVESRTPGSPGQRTPLFSWRVAKVRVQDAFFSFSDPNRQMHLSIDGVDMSLFGPLYRWEHQGKIAFRNGTFELNGVRKPIRELYTEFTVRSNTGELSEFILKLGQSVVKIRGSVRDFKRLLLAGRLESALDLSDAGEFWHLGQQIEGVVNLEIEAAGTLEEIAGNLSLNLPTSRLRSIRLEQLRLQARFDRQGLYVHHLTARVAGGDLTGNFQITAQEDDLFYEGRLDLRQMDADAWFRMLYSWPEQFKRFAGQVDVSLRMNGFLSNLGTLNISGEGTWLSPSVNNVALGKSSVHFQVRGDQLQGQGVLDDGAFTISGHLGYQRPRAIRHQFARFQVGHWTRALELPDLAGDAQVTVDLNAGEPARLRFTMPEAHLYGVPVGRVQGRAQLVDNQLPLERVLVDHPGGSHVQITGSAVLSSDLPMDLQVRLDPLELEHFVKFTGAAHPLQGWGRGTLHLQGEFRHLTGRGRFDLTDLTAWGLPLDDLSVQMEVSESVFRIPPTPVMIAGQRGELELSVDLDKRYSLAVRTERCELAALREPYHIGWPLDAFLGAEIVARGDGTQNELTIRAETDELRFAGERLGPAALTGTLQSDGRIHVEGNGLNGAVRLQMVLGETPGQGSHPATPRGDSRTPIEWSLQFHQLRLEPFVAALHVPTLRHFQGWATGSFIGRGDLQHPETLQSRLTFASLTLQGRQGYVNLEPIEIRLQGSLIQIQSLRLGLAVDRTPVIAILGEISSDGYAVTFQGESFPLSVLLDLTQQSGWLAGQGRIRGTIRGSREKPEISLAWHFPQARLILPEGEAPFRSGASDFPTFVLKLEAIQGQAEGTPEMVTLTTSLQMEGNPLQLAGSWPLRPSASSEGHALTLTFDLSDLNFLQTAYARLTELPPLATLEGRLQGRLVLTPHPQSPRLTGTIDGSQLRLRWSAWPQALEAGRFHLRWDAAESVRLTLERADARIVDADLHLEGEVRYPIDLKGLVALKSPLPPPQVSLEGTLRNYAVQPLLRAAARKPDLPVEGRVSATINLEGQGFDWQRYTGDVAIEQFRAQLAEHALVLAQPLRLSLREGRLFFDQFSLYQNGHPFELSGFVALADRQVQLRAHAEAFDLSMLSFLMTAPYPLRGLLTFDLDVKGDRDAPQMQATWALRGIGTQAAQLDALVGEASYRNRRLLLKRTRISGYGNQLVLSGQIPIDLSLKLMPTRQRLLPQPIDLAIQGRDVELGFLAAFSQHAQQAEGKADLALHVRGTTAQPHLEGTLAVRDGTIRLHGFDVPLEAGTLSMKAERGALRFERVSFRIGAGRYLGQGAFRMAGLTPRAFVGSLRGEHAQLADLARNFLPSRIAQKLGGEASFEMDVNLDLARWSEEVRRRRIPLLAPRTLLRHVRGEFRLEDLQLQFGDILIQNLDPDPATPEREPIRLVLGDRTLTIAGLRLRDTTGQHFEARLADERIWELNGQIQLHLKGRFSETLVQGFLPAWPQLRGVLRYQLDVQGTERQPILDAQWRVTRLFVNEVPVDAFEGAIHYASNLITVSRTRPIRAVIGRNYLNLIGRIPFEVVLPERRWRFLTASAQVDLNARLPDLGFLSLLHPAITYASGEAELSLTLGGNIRQPGVSGFSRVRALSLGLADAGLDFAEVNGELQFSREALRLEDLSGQLNGGRFGIRGEIKLANYRPDEIRLSGELDQVTFQKPGVYEILCTSDRGDLRLQGSIRQPHLTGSLTIVQGRYERPWEELVQSWFRYKSEAQSAVIYDIPLLRHLTVDLAIEAPDNLRLDTQGLVDIQASASGRLVGPLNSLVFVGDVYLTEGEFYFMEHAFQLDRRTPGVIRNQDETLFNPTYQIAAESIIPSVQLYDLDGNLLTKDVRVHVDLTGSLLKPAPPVFQVEVLQPEGRQFPALDSQQAFWLLTIGRPAPLNTEGILSLTETAPGLLSKGQRYVFSRFGRVLGLQALQVELDRQALEASRILFTKELTPRWLITYSSSLHEEPRIEVEYKLSERISISAERNERGQYGIDLKLEHEFD